MPPMPEGKERPSRRYSLSTDVTGRPAPLGHPLEVPQQVRPAELSMGRGHPAVGTIAITPDGAGKVRSKQGLRGGLVTVRVDPKHALRRTDRHPQTPPGQTDHAGRWPAGSPPSGGYSQ